MTRWKNVKVDGAMSTNPYEPPSEAGGYTRPAEQLEPTESAGATAYGVVVRSLGFFFCYGIWCFGYLFGYAVGMPEAYAGDRQGTFVSGVTVAVGGILLLVLAKPIVAVSYPK